VWKRAIGKKGVREGKSSKWLHSLEINECLQVGGTMGSKEGGREGGREGGS